MTQEEIIARLVEVEARSKSNTHRLDKLTVEIEAVNRLATAVEVMATKQDTMGQSVNRLENKVDALESKPGKRWEGIVDKALQTIIGALVGAALVYIGMTGG